jgi:hypothetical protein
MRVMTEENSGEKSNRRVEKVHIEELQWFLFYSHVRGFTLKLQCMPGMWDSKEQQINTQF